MSGTLLMSLESSSLGISLVSCEIDVIMEPGSSPLTHFSPESLL